MPHEPTPDSPFSDLQLTDDRCFLCGTRERVLTQEHVFPKWLQQRYDLWDKRIGLLNDSEIRYRELRIPCCVTCNNEDLSRLESTISSAVSSGYNACVVVILINTVGKVDKRREFVHRADDDTLHWVLGDVEPPELASALEQAGRNSASERQRVWYVACSRAREMLIVPAVPPRKIYKPWCQVIENVYDGIPELPALKTERVRSQRPAEQQNFQSIEKFEEERGKVLSAVRKIRWLKPSEEDPDRVRADTSSVVEATTDAPETPTPIGAGRIRGLALHKLIEEVLTGELFEEPAPLSARAAYLIEQLSSGKSGLKDLPEASELAGTVQRTLALPEVTAMRPKLVPEVSIYGMHVGEVESIALSGRADALAIEEDRVSIVVDWKSDIAPTADDVRSHAQQLRDYIVGTGASRGALVYMTTGTVHWVEAGNVVG